MNLLKITLLSFFLLAAKIGLPEKAVAKFRMSVCHVSSTLGDILPRANDVSTHYSGFHLAISDFRKKCPSCTVDFKVYQPKTKLSVVDGISWAKSQDCHLIVGLVSTRDALLSAPILAKYQLYGISSTATADEIQEFYPHLVSMGISQSQWISNVLRYVKKNDKKNIFIVSKSDDIYSTLFTEKLRKKSQLHTYFSLDRGNLLKDSDLNQLRQAQSAAILYTTYPIQSVPSLKQIIELSKQTGGIRNWSVFGTSSWHETHTFNAFREVVDFSSRMFVFLPWDAKDSQNQKNRRFLELYKKTYQSFPDHDSVYDYDSLSFVLECVFKLPEGKGIQERIASCFQRKEQFNGILGHYEFDGFTAHPKRTLVPTQYRSTGLLPLEK